MECVHYFVCNNNCIYGRRKEDNEQQSISLGALENRNRINSFVNRTPLPLLLEISGALLIVLVDLTAGRQAGRLAGRLSDEIPEVGVIFKIRYRMKYLIHRFVLLRYYVIIVLTISL